MMQNNVEEWLILGITAAGKTFRPSDWAERLCGAFATYLNNRWTYSDYAYPVIHEGTIGVRVKTTLQIADPAGYAFVMNFARSNQLQLIPFKQSAAFDESINTAEVALSINRLAFTLWLHQWKANAASKRLF